MVLPFFVRAVCYLFIFTELCEKTILTLSKPIVGFIVTMTIVVRFLRSTVFIVALVAQAIFILRSFRVRAFIDFQILFSFF